MAIITRLAYSRPGGCPEMARERSLVLTEDGSLSRRDAETGELFHNRAGAITEALKNYIEPAGAVERIRETGSLTVLDACFGLGYNTWVLLETVLASVSSTVHVKVTGIERDFDVLSDAISVLQDLRLERVRQFVGTASPNAKPGLSFATSHIWQSGTTSCELTLAQGDLRQVVPELSETLDLVFHDPFSPVRMPELWTVDLFRQYFRLLKPKGGRLLTYSAAAAVRGGLREAGFSVWRTEAVGSKSGGTLACSEPISTAPHNFPLRDEEEQKMRSRAGIPYRDPSLSAARGTILHNRLEEQKRIRDIRLQDG